MEVGNIPVGLAFLLFQPGKELTWDAPEGHSLAGHIHMGRRWAYPHRDQLDL